MLFGASNFTVLLVLIASCFAKKTTQESFTSKETLEQTFEQGTNSELLWAPYRSNCYFGIRPRFVDGTPFIFGLMWFDTTKFDSMTRLRHFVSDEDHLERFTWEAYDPRLGGRENIIDPENNLNLTIHFAKTHDDQNWIVRVNGKPLDPTLNTTTSVILYMNQNIGKDPEGPSRLMHINNGNTQDENTFEFTGISEDLGKYEVLINDNYGNYYTNDTLDSIEVVPGCNASRSSHVGLTIPDTEVWRARDIFQSLLTDSIKDIVKELGETIDSGLVPSVLTLRNLHEFDQGNFHYIQKTFDMREEKGFEFDVVYNNMDSTQTIDSGKQATKLINDAIYEINVRFDNHFDIEDTENTGDKRKFAMEVLGNLLGGIGYFHGTQVIDRETVLDEDQFESIKFEHFKEEGPYSLFTSVPSRGFFPRGFYWDEGFHLLQIMEYDFDLAFQIAVSWFNLIDENGWVAREVILGPEARSKVPQEFTIQSPQIANPPTLLLALSEMLTKLIENENELGFSHSVVDAEQEEGISSQLGSNFEYIIKYSKIIYPRLQSHFKWFTETQKGLIEEYLEDMEDDEQFQEVHQNFVYRWLGRTVTHCLPSGLDDYPRAEIPDVAELNVDALAWVGTMARSMKNIAHILGLEKDELQYAETERKIVENLDLLHWDSKTGTYCDVTLDAEGDDEMQRVCHEGYVSLLPFALKLMPRNSPKLKNLLTLMSDPEKLFSPFGLRSLSKQDEHFGAGENYWRGKIWMNINYLCLDAIQYYFPEVIAGSPETSELHDKEVSNMAKKLYNTLRENLINNVYGNWKETNYVYENYDPVDGHGTGSVQFTGWTSLIVNILRHQGL
ncbi:similar to Saccharomyces cerevisiae YGL027C CWH41 Processing alpha glucosidase I [Maudiozyma saulgeensis]|uniref:Mannosyl-oligosaccharide glucosidase n=1 Tax=Maudiozyma saulgeensis TaxID=1789683 RepID=A0A1X7RAM1_9SACH|nr:similar to Saccharomyces cerevisiae YGL027C CWH41 Processing alpha glucosidase I [Kazachstania saulgeensis]